MEKREARREEIADSRQGIIVDSGFQIQYKTDENEQNREWKIKHRRYTIHVKVYKLEDRRFKVKARR